MEIEKIRNILKYEMETLFDIEIVDLDKNLLSSDFEIKIEDFLILFERLKKIYEFDLYSIVEKNDCNAFTINNISKRLV